MRNQRMFWQFLLLFFFSISTSNIQAQNLDEGKNLFKVNCASCHNKNMKDNMTGPALAGIEERWEGREELLYDWIRNSQSVIASGDEYAVKIFKEYNNSVMTAFPNLTDDQIASMLAYINGVADGTYPPKEAGAADAAGDQVAIKSDNTLLFVTLFVILGILAVVLARIISNLNHMAQIKAGATNVQRRTLVDILTSKGMIAFVVFAIVVLGGYTTVNNAIDLGRQQGYQPDQPIKFSHVVHAGQQQIDCQYCHDGARRSKHSVIPAANTCMNCHKAIEKGSTYGTAELTKIFASIGYDPSTDKYIENYDNMSQEEVADIYKKWIKDSYVSDNEDSGTSMVKLAEEAAEEADNQWDAIFKALTNEQKKKVQGPIEWVRIHNLPDHAYFNHSQHVSIGKIECQQCHGPVEEMEVVQQYSPLSMGWCVNCHVQTEVKFTENNYYKDYERYHEELESGKRNAVTVEDIGGLECQKCHY